MIERAGNKINSRDGMVADVEYKQLRQAESALKHEAFAKNQHEYLVRAMNIAEKSSQSRSDVLPKARKPPLTIKTSKQTGGAKVYLPLKPKIIAKTRPEKKDKDIKLNILPAAKLKQSIKYVPTVNILNKPKSANKVLEKDDRPVISVKRSSNKSSITQPLRTPNIAAEHDDNILMVQSQSTDVFQNNFSEPALQSDPDSFNGLIKEANELQFAAIISEILGNDLTDDMERPDLVDKTLEGRIFETDEVPVATDVFELDNPVTEDIVNNLAHLECLEEVLVQSFDQNMFTYLNSQESAKSDEALHIFKSIIVAANNALDQKELSAETIANQELVITQLCENLFECIGISYTSDSANIFLQNIKNAILAQHIQTNDVNLLELSGSGTHEHKFSHNFSPIKLLIIIKLKLQQHARLGRYVLGVIAN